VARSRSEQMGAIIDSLNGIHVGRLETIQGRLGVVREELKALGEPELDSTFEEACGSLSRGDAGNFRRLVSQVVSRLGHVKARQG
jgi:hypothetical protein